MQTDVAEFIAQSRRPRRPSPPREGKRQGKHDAQDPSTARKVAVITDKNRRSRHPHGPPPSRPETRTHHITGRSSKPEVLPISRKPTMSDDKALSLKALMKSIDSDDSLLQTTGDDLEDVFNSLSDALDDISSLHPFVAVATNPFKVAFKLYLAQRNNDQKIAMIYTAMKDMIIVLFELFDVDTDNLQRKKKGYTIQSQLKTLLHVTADDIKDCANMCDAYIKQNRAWRYLKAPKWEGKLRSYVKLFAKRRDEFVQALALDAYMYLRSIHSRLASYEAAFTWLITQEKQQTIHGPDGKNPLGVMEATSTTTDPDEAISRNRQIFDRKFELCWRDISTQLKQVQNNLGAKIDQIRKHAESGPHEQIKHPILRDLWREMGWKRNVKANLFVNTLRDYVLEQNESKFNVADAWAVKYIDMAWLRPISEALDNDTSGYITVGELNHFTDARPKNLSWSLPHWIAYWAIGWRLTAEKYRNDIHDVVAKMSAMVPYIHHYNRAAIGRYLAILQLVVAQLTLSLQTTQVVPPNMFRKFEAFVVQEEARVQKNLERVRYSIDALDVVYVVTGPGRIEEHILIVLYCLLRHHFQMLKAAQNKTLVNEEWVDARNSLRMVFTAVCHRVADVKVSFKQRELDPDKQFKLFASGLFDFVHDDSSLWSMSKLHEPHAKLWFQPSPLFSQDALNAALKPDSRQSAFRAEVSRDNLGKSFKGLVHNFCLCSSCGAKEIRDSRILCLDCVEPTARISQTVSCCDVDRCFAKTIQRTGLRTHQASHDVLKLRIEVGWMDLPAIYQSASEALRQSRLAFNKLNSRADAGYLGPRGGDSKRMNSQSCCAVCGGTVQQPCWYCVTCKNFICDDCENRMQLACILCRRRYTQSRWYYGYKPYDTFRCNTCPEPKHQLTNAERLKQHIYTHPLVRCKVRTEDVKDLKDIERIQALEKRSELIERKLDGVAEKIGQILQLFASTPYTSR